jgi:hypothetical protein
MLDDILSAIIDDTLMPRRLKRYLDSLKRRSWLKAFLYVLWQIFVIIIFGVALYLIFRFLN